MDWRDIKEFIKDTIGYVIFIAVVLFIAIYVVGLQQVIGDSMNPNFENRDILILDKITYRFKKPERGDVIAFNTADENFFIKRIIGLPGEKIEIVDNILYIDNIAYKEDYLNEDEMEDFRLTDLGYETIPEDMYFVLGDNRNNSKDSRNPKVGLVKKENIMGQVRVRFWPLKKAEIYK